MILKKILVWIYNIPARIIIKEFGYNSKIYWPAEIRGGKNMIIGNYCYIKKDSWITALPFTNEQKTKFVLGNGSHINRNCQIVVTKEIIIGENVAIGDNVFITDCTHPYEDVNQPILKQPVKQGAPVHIGNDSWIGRGASIMSAKIGKHCVIGNGAFVKKDIPDHCVVVGSPAKIVRRYCFESESWRKTDSDGNFI